MAITYKKNSPYAGTPVYGKFLDILEYRKISKKPDDVTYKINSVYKYRPDMLAYDLYKDSNLWWVFAVRNPNNIKDPVFDFVPGRQIFVPKKETLVTALGL
mgnify:CR=1 FL=1